VNGNLSDLREAIALATTDLAKALDDMRAVVAATQHEPTCALFSRIEGNIHEIELLRKRELTLLTHGREVMP